MLVVISIEVMVVQGAGPRGCEGPAGIAWCGVGGQIPEPRRRCGPPVQRIAIPELADKTR